MARKKGALDAVQFTRESAERIAGVVRAAEQAPTPTLPLTFERLQETRLPKSIRSATFSGAWPIGSSKVVTFANLPTNTANVQNLSWPITSSGYSNEPCLVGKEGTAWYLIVPRLQTATAIFVTQTQAGTSLVSIAIAATLNTSNCTITVSQTPNTTAITLIAAAATSSYLRLQVP